MAKKYGRIGRKQYGGTFYEEYLKELRGLNGIEVYKEMEMDDVCGSILYAIDIICRQVDWQVNPGGTSKIDREAADFVYNCLYDMKDNWSDIISEIMTFLLYGWSWLEIEYKRRNGSKGKSPSKYDDGLIGWTNWEIRSQDTLMRWEINDEEDVIGLTQQVDGKIYTIPRDKSLHFKSKSKKSNPEGISILRNAYRAWYFKKRIQEIEGIGIERDLAGLPMLKAPENVDIWNNEDETMVMYRKYAETMVQNVRRDSTEGIVIPAGWEFSLLTGGSKRNFDTGAVIERYDKRISMTVLADFIMLGHEGVGSYAMANSKMDMFYKSLKTYLDNVQEEINNVAVRKLIDLNGDTFKGITDYPELIHGNVETVDITNLSDFLTKMIGAGIITPDETLEDYVRMAGKLPERQDKAADEEIEVEEDKDIKEEVDAI